MPKYLVHAKVPATSRALNPFLVEAPSGTAAGETVSHTGLSVEKVEDCGPAMSTLPVWGSDPASEKATHYRSDKRPTLKGTIIGCLAVSGLAVAFVVFLVVGFGVHYVLPRLQEEHRQEHRQEQIRKSIEDNMRKSFQELRPGKDKQK